VNLIYSYRKTYHGLDDPLIKKNLPAVLIAAYANAKDYDPDFSKPKNSINAFAAYLGGEDTWELKEGQDLVKTAEIEYQQYKKDQELTNAKLGKLKLD
jgi:hypothetical protein